jgi:hypothetical protein
MYTYQKISFKLETIRTVTISTHIRGRGDSHLIPAWAHTNLPELLRPFVPPFETKFRTAFSLLYCRLRPNPFSINHAIMCQFRSKYLGTARAAN